MAHSITTIHGLEEGHAEELARHGIRNTDQLIRRVGSPSELHELSRNTGFPVAQLRRWGGLAQVMRVPGVGPGFAELLALAGVDSLPQLSRRHPVGLARRLGETVRLNKDSPNAPSPRVVARWITDARKIAESAPRLRPR